MHIVVSWDIRDATQARWSAIDKGLLKCLEGYSWARPLTTFYVVRVNSEADRTTIRDRMVNVAKSGTETVNFVLSPVMVGGRYDGFLPATMWPVLNQRSDP